MAEALTASSGLPAASGNNLTLTGTFDVGINLERGDCGMVIAWRAARIRNKLTGL